MTASELRDRIGRIASSRERAREPGDEVQGGAKVPEPQVGGCSVQCSAHVGKEDEITERTSCDQNVRVSGGRPYVDAPGKRERLWSDFP